MSRKLLIFRDAAASATIPRPEDDQRRVGNKLVIVNFGLVLGDVAYLLAASYPGISSPEFSTFASG